MKHISKYLVNIGNPPTPENGDLRALQIQREEVQASGDLKALRAIDARIEDLVMGGGK